MVLHHNISNMAENEQNIQSKEESLFIDWGPYLNIKLPEGFKYTPPQPREDLRKKLAPLEGKQIDPIDKTILKMVLHFLEMGTIEDNFGDNDKERDEFLLTHTIELSEESISLYHFSKKVNKLHGNASSRIVLALDLLGEDFEQQTEELKKHLEKIKEEKGYFSPKDLLPVNKAAEDVLKQIAGKYRIKI